MAIEKNDKPQEKECAAVSTQDHVAAEARDCMLDPKHATPDTAGQHLTGLTIVDSEAEAQVAQNADIVRDGLTNYFFWQSADVDKVVNVLNGMTIEGRQQLIAKYGEGGNQFWDDLKENLGEGTPEYARVEALMNEKAASGDAGTARIALATLAEDPEKGINLLRAIVAGKDAAQIATLDRDYQDAFGTSLKSTIENLDESVMSSFKKEIFKTLLTGTDNIDSAAISKMAKLAAKDGDAKLLVNLLAGDDDKDIAARASLLKDPEFMADVAANFSHTEARGRGQTISVVDQDVMNAITKGKVALDAILKEDAVGIYSNIENSNFTFENATAKDRADFRLGREMVESGRQPATPAEEEALRKYNDLVKAMSLVTPSERAVLTDSLLHGEKTLISDIAGAYSSGTLGFGAGFDKHAALSAVENMDAHKFALLSNPEYKKEFDTQIAAMISDESLRTAVMEMVNAKLAVEKTTVDSNPPGYTDSQGVRRSLEQFMADLAESDPSHADQQIVDRLAQLSSTEAQSYNSDPTYKASVDQFVKDYVDSDAATALANLRLASAGSEKSETTRKLEVFLQNQMNVDAGADAADPQAANARKLKEIAQVEELMKDPELLARMQSVYERSPKYVNGELVPGEDGPVDSQDALLYNIFSKALPSEMQAAGMDTGVGLGMAPLQKSNWETLLTDGQGQSSIYSKLILSREQPGDWMAGHYEDVARLSEAQRAELKLSAEQQELVANAISNGGTLDLAGRFREYAISGGDIAPLMAAYAKLTPAERDALGAKYGEQFGQKELLADLRSRVAGADMSDEEKKVWQRVIDNNGDVQLVDKMKLFVLGTNEKVEYSDFRADLSKLTLEQRSDLKELYSNVYGGNLDEQFLAKVPDKDIDRYRGYLSLAEVDEAKAFFDRLARFEPLGTFDGTTKAQERMLQINENLLRQFNDAMAKLPPEAQEAMAEYYSKSYQNNLDSNEKYAHFVADMAVTAITVAAAIALAPETGGASLGATVAAYATAGGAIRVGVIKELQGGTFDSSPESVLGKFAVGAFQGAVSAPFLGGKTLVTAAGTLERRTLEETAAAVVEVQAKPVLTSEVVTNAAEVVTAQADVVLPKATAVVTQADAVVTQADAVVTQADAVVTQADEVVTQADAVVTQADTAVTQADTAVVKPEVIEPVQTVQAAEAVVEQTQKFDIPETGLIDLGTMFKATAPEDQAALMKAIVEARPKVPVGSWMRHIEPSEMEAFLRASYQNYPDTLNTAQYLVNRGMLRPLDESVPIDFAAWERAITTVRAEVTANTDTAIAAVPVVAQRVEAVADDAVEAAVVADRVVPTPVVAEVKTAEQIAAETTEMQAKFNSGAVTRAELETAARNGDPVAKNVLATVAEREALAAAAEKQALIAAAEKEAAATKFAQAYEDVRLTAVKSAIAARVAQAAIMPSAVSEVAESMTAKDAPVEVPIAAPVPVPSEDLIAMATVRRGEGPWQSAERILAADGKRHGIDEVRALTKAIQAVYAAEHDGNGDMSGLKVKHTFVTQDNYDDLIAACNNDAVKAVLQGFAQGAAV